MMQGRLLPNLRCTTEVFQQWLVFAGRKILLQQGVLCIQIRIVLIYADHRDHAGADIPWRAGAAGLQPGAV